jgi:phosphotransferase system HPr-like phosphotransfer protein
MTAKKIKFSGIDVIDEVKQIVAISTVCKHDIDVVSGRYVVDAKSIMGWFSLDLSMPLTIMIHAEEADCADTLARLEKFIENGNGK